MPFPESVKLEANKKALFQCVACHGSFVEVHHIIPKSEGGPDTLDNAASLCAGCHSIYGGNPDFRKQIRQMRDNWYDVCQKKFGPSSTEVPQQLNALGETLRTMRADQVKYQDTLNEIKATIVGSLSGTVDVIKSAETIEQVVAASSGYSATGVYLGPNVYANFKCSKCGTIIGLLVGNNKCPTCGELIKS